MHNSSLKAALTQAIYNLARCFLNCLSPVRLWPGPPFLLRQGKRHIHSAGLRFKVLASAGGNGYILAAVYFIRDGSGVSGEWQSRLPQWLASRFVNRAELLVIVYRP